MKRYLDTILILVLGMALILWAIPTLGASDKPPAPSLRACTLDEMNDQLLPLMRDLDQDWADVHAAANTPEGPTRPRMPNESAAL